MIEILFDALENGDVVTNNQVGADHTGLSIGCRADSGQDSFRFYTLDAQQSFYNSATGNDTTGTGTRANPFLTRSKAETIVDSITIFCTTQLNSGIDNSSITQIAQCDTGISGRITNTVGSWTFKASGFQVEASQTINTGTAAASSVINCTFTHGTSMTVTFSSGNFDKCLFKKTQIDWNATFQSHPLMTDSELDADTNCLIQNKVDVIYIDNSIISKFRSDTDIITDLIFVECTFDDSAEQPFYVGDQNAIDSVSFERCIILDDTANDIFQPAFFENNPDLNLFECVLKAASGQHVINMTGQPDGEIKIDYCTIIEDLRLVFDSNTKLAASYIYDSIVQSNITLTGAHTGNFNFYSGNQQNIFSNVGNVLLGAVRVYDVDPEFTDQDNDDYRLARIQLGNIFNSPLLGRSFFERTSVFSAFVRDASTDMGAYDTELTNAQTDYLDGLRMLDLIKQDAAKLNYPITSHKHKGSDGEITVYTNPDTREEILILALDVIKDDTKAAIQRLRSLTDTRVKIKLNENDITTSSVTVNGLQNQYEIVLDINSAILMSGVKLLINGTYEPVLYGVDANNIKSFYNATKLVMNKPLQVSIPDTTVLTTSLSEFVEYQYNPLAINMNRVLSNYAKAFSGTVLTFTRKL